MNDNAYAPVAPWLRRRLFEGLVIPAHPLALFDDGKFDEASQRGLTRYYHESGAGGIAVAVHTTQFSIREPQHGLFEPVLRIAAEEVSVLDEDTGRQTVLIAGVVGRTDQAVAEARLAASLGYHAGLLSLAAFPGASDDELIAHCNEVAGEIPLFGFYLQRAVGGRRLSKDFWKRFASIPNVVGIKIAPFNRYETIDVVRAVAEAGREREVALYTGNDDHIVLDLITTFEVLTDRGPVYLGMVGDACIEGARRESDPAKRMALFRRAEELACRNEFPFLPIYYYVNQGMAKPKVKGIIQNILDLHPWQYIWIEPEE